jgi:hypothetical protein
MADLALWATACEPGFCPGSGFLHAYKANRRSAVENVVDADPLASRIRDIMAERTMWSGSASDLLQSLARVRELTILDRRGWPSRLERWPAGFAGRRRRFARWELK